MPSHAERLVPLPYDEDAYLQRVLDANAERSPLVVMNDMLDRAVDAMTCDSMSEAKQVERSLRRLSPAFSRAAVAMDEEYVLLLARQQAGQAIDVSRLEQLDGGLREMFEQFHNAVLSLLEDMSALRGNPMEEFRDVPHDESVTARALMGQVLLKYLSDAQRGVLISVGTHEDYLNRLRQTVRLVGHEFGLGASQSGPSL